MRTFCSALVLSAALVISACNGDDEQTQDASTEDTSTEDVVSETDTPSGCPDPSAVCASSTSHGDAEVVCVFTGNGEVGCSGEWNTAQDGQVRCIEDSSSGRAYWESSQPEQHNDLGTGCTVTEGEYWTIDTTAPEPPPRCKTYFISDSVYYENHFAESAVCLAWAECRCE